MGRLDEFAVQRAIVQTIIRIDMKGKIATRQAVMHTVTANLGITERSFAKALMQIDKAGILVKKTVPVFLNELNVRGERRKGIRTGLSIDIAEAINRSADLWAQKALNVYKDYPEETREFLFDRYRKARGQTLLNQIDIAREALRKWGRSDISTLTPGEVIYINVFVPMVMEYLRALREKNKTA